MVGAERFELSTFCTPSKRATRLRYAPRKVVKKCAYFSLFQSALSTANHAGCSFILGFFPASLNLYRKNRYESANASPASPMNTWTAERAFARNHLKFHQQKTSFLLMKRKPDSSGWLSVLPCCMQREADVITTLFYCGFCGKAFHQTVRGVKSLNGMEKSLREKPETC
jgi:hypothetical protein